MSLQEVYNCLMAGRRLRKKASLGNHEESLVYLHNFWDVSAEDMWLTQFMKKRGILSGRKRISFYSVFGDRRIVRYDKREIKVFIAGENVHLPQYEAYSDNLLFKREVDLSLGFDYLEDEHYLRFPLWLRTSFLPEWSEKEIINQVKRLRYPEIGERSLFATLIARYDWNNTRSRIYASLDHLGEIKCPSWVLHNDDRLKTVYGNNKIAYLRQFCFNICPENSNYPGYVTEKLFDAILAGCVPIYWGSDNQPEPEVLNQDAIILWNMEGDNNLIITQLHHLWNNRRELDAFMHQPRLKEGAEGMIVSLFNQLEEVLRQVLS